MMIDAGKMDRRIAILHKTTTRDAAGQASEAWTTVANLYAQRLELRTTDIARMAGRDPMASARYLIRYREDVSPLNRIRVGAVDYAITAVDEPDRKTTMILTVEEAK